jgi:hypothetical protein
VVPALAADRVATGARPMTERRAKGPGVEAAIAAWAAVRSPGAGGRPTLATTLKPLSGGSAVYRLVGAGPAGRDVIAKWTWRQTVELEASLYAEVLPRLPVATVRCYGTAPDGDEAMAWLLLEDARGVPYSPSRPDHRRLAAQWLAALHTALPGRPERCALATRDAAHYRRLLERTVRAIAEGFANPALQAEHLPSLRAALERTGMLLGRWPEVERLCAGMPQTLVHADFVAKNVRIQEREGTSTLQAFDWEQAAWGLPAIDLTAIDLDEYARCVRATWPAFAGSDMRTVARVGRILWFTTCIAWESWALATDSVWRLTKNLPVFERELGAVMGELGWS